MDDLPAGPGWVAQVKWDGVRILTYSDGREVHLFNRRRNNRTLHYPELVDVSAYSTAKSVIYDGEVIAWRRGKPSFFEVMKRDAVRRQSAIRSVVQQVPVTYMIFDILYLDGEWLTSLPLQKRQALLAEVTRPTDRIQLVQNFDDAEGLYNAVRQQGLEGIVVKDLASTYPLNGRDGRWRKKKVYRDVVAAVGGVTLRDGVVNALLLGLYDTEGRLWYVGHVGTGKLSHQDWLRLTEGIAPLRQMDMPFVVKPPRSAGAVWLKPTLAVKVQFADWTDGRTLRQPSIQAFVPMDVRECRFEESEAP